MILNENEPIIIYNPNSNNDEREHDQPPSNETTLQKEPVDSNVDENNENPFA